MPGFLDGVVAEQVFIGVGVILVVLIARSAFSALCWCGAQYCMLMPFPRANNSKAVLAPLSSR